MKYYLVLACILTFLLAANRSEASRFWLINTGSNSTNDVFGRNQGIMNLLPLSADFSLKFYLESTPSDTNPGTIKFNKLDTTHKLYSGSEIGYLFTSGINLTNSVPKLTLQLGGGYALQNVMNFARGTVSGTQWQLGSKGTVVFPVGYAGLLYRLSDICITAGYNIRKGAAVGISWNW